MTKIWTFFLLNTADQRCGVETCMKWSRSTATVTCSSTCQRHIFRLFDSNSRIKFHKAPVKYQFSKKKKKPCESLWIANMFWTEIGNAGSGVRPNWRRKWKRRRIQRQRCSACLHHFRSAGTGSLWTRTWYQINKHQTFTWVSELKWSLSSNSQIKSINSFSMQRIATHRFCNQVSPATMRKRDAKARAKDPNSMGSSARNLLTPTI